MSRAQLQLALVTTLVVTIGTPHVSHAQALADGSRASNQPSSLVAFTIYTQGLFKLKREGRFREVAGELSYDPAHPADTHVNLIVNTASVDMNNVEHNELLRSRDFFDVEDFPTMRFTSETTETTPDGGLVLNGDLTIRGITKRIAVPVTMNVIPQAGGTLATRFETTFPIDRTEFGLNGVPHLKGFNVSIAKRVLIHVAIATGLRSTIPPR